MVGEGDGSYTRMMVQVVPASSAFSVVGDCFSAREELGLAVRVGSVSTGAATSLSFIECTVDLPALSTWRHPAHAFRS